MKEIYLIMLSLIGFFVSAYIFYSKKYDKPLYCPIGENCDDVVRSKYGKIFGIENAIPGMIYYAIVFFYGFSLFLNQNIFKGIPFHYFIVGMGVGAVLFSAYLTIVQAAILKKWCYYCIISSVSSFLILLVLI